MGWMLLPIFPCFQLKILEEGGQGRSGYSCHNLVIVPPIGLIISNPFPFHPECCLLEQTKE